MAGERLSCKQCRIGGHSCGHGWVYEWRTGPNPHGLAIAPTHKCTWAIVVERTNLSAREGYPERKVVALLDGRVLAVLNRLLTTIQRVQRPLPDAQPRILLRKSLWASCQCLFYMTVHVLYRETPICSCQWSKQDLVAPIVLFALCTPPTIELRTIAAL